MASIHETACSLYIPTQLSFLDLFPFNNEYRYLQVSLLLIWYPFVSVSPFFSHPFCCWRIPYMHIMSFDQFQSSFPSLTSPMLPSQYFPVSTLCMFKFTYSVSMCIGKGPLTKRKQALKHIPFSANSKSAKTHASQLNTYVSSESAIKNSLLVEWVSFILNTLVLCILDFKLIVLSLTIVCHQIIVTPHPYHIYLHGLMWNYDLELKGLVNA